MNLSLILGLIVIVVFVLIRIGQQDGNKKFGAIWTRLNQAVPTMTTTHASVTSTGTTVTRKPFPLVKIIGVAILIVVFVHFYTGHGFLGFGGYSKTLELEVSTLEPHQLCGVPSGKHTFSIPKGHEVEVFINSEKTDITSAVRVNKTFPGEKFEVESDGCVSISFSVNESFQKNKFARQIVAIAFH